MSLPASFTLGLLEKIGAPLVSAIEVTASSASESGEIDTSTILAQMLGQSVQASISLSASVEMPTEEAAADSARLGMAGLVASVIADFYRAHKRVPNETDMGRIVKALQSVAAFGENFQTAQDQASRLALLGQDTLLFDALQVNLVVMQIMTPVMNAITEFPFGQSETKLMQEVSDKLQTYAQDLVKLTGDTSKLAEMMTLKSLAQIYAQCHLSETERLMKASDEARASVTIESVWTHFDKKLAMAEVMVGINDSARGTQNAGTDSAGVAPAVATPEAPVTATAQPAQPLAQVAPVAEPPPAAGGSPMGFFKPKTEGAEAPVATAPVAATPPPAQAQPPAQAPATAPPPVAPARTPPPATAPAAAGGPMSFFKPKTDEGT